MSCLCQARRVVLALITGLLGGPCPGSEGTHVSAFYSVKYLSRGCCAVEAELEIYIPCFREHGRLWLGGRLRKREAVWSGTCRDFGSGLLLLFSFVSVWPAWTRAPCPGVLTHGSGVSTYRACDSAPAVATLRVSSTGADDGSLWKIQWRNRIPKFAPDSFLSFYRHLKRGNVVEINNLF